MWKVGWGEKVVSLIVLPVDLFLVPFFGSLAFVFCPWSFAFDLGKGLWPKGGLLPIFLHPTTCCSGMRWQRAPHLSEW